MKTTCGILNYLSLSAWEGGEGGCLPLAGYCADYRLHGEGPPLVLLPGLAGGAALVEPLSRLLSENFRVHVPEPRGERQPFDFRHRVGVADLVGDVVEFCDVLRLERPILMGISFGGAIALEAAVRHPSRFSAVIVQGADIRFEPTLLRRVAGEILNGYPLPTDSPFVNQFFNLLFGFRPQDKRLVRFVTETCWQTDQAVMARRFNLASEIDLTGRLGSLRIPALLLRGGRDLFVSAKGTAEMVMEIPEAESVELPTAGHLAFLTHAREISRLVVRFAHDVGLLDAVASANSCDTQA